MVLSPLPMRSMQRLLVSRTLHQLRANNVRPRLLDLFCRGGGASMGYYLAGFDVLGVDIAKQPRYPFPFVQADALEFVALYGDRFDAIHASPPCQRFSQLAARWPEREYPDLITPLRPLLVEKSRPYVIENVEGAPLENPFTLCGSMFDLGTPNYQLRRHRSFEAHPLILALTCQHDQRSVITVTGHAGRASRNGTGSTAERREAMAIPWLTSDDLVEAIPPAYTEWIGAQLLTYIREAVAA